MNDEPVYPVRYVTRRTGLSADVLRAWEKRYGLVAPGRTESGQRVYSADEVERLVLLAEATRAGHGISRIAALRADELRRLLAVGRRDEQGWTVDPAEVVDRAIENAIRLDATTLESRLRTAALRLGAPRFVEEVAAPLAIELGERWHEGSVRPIHEHVATTVLRSVLAWIAQGIEVAPGAPLILVTTPVGHRHEIGAWLAASAATLAGWRVIAPGASLPAADIALGARESGARAVGLSVVYPADDDALSGELALLRDGIGRGVAILVGGGAAAGYRAAIEAVGGEVVESLAALRGVLARLAGPSVESREAAPLTR